MSERVMKALANCEQGLSNEQKLQARTNIGAIGGVKVTDSSGTTELVPDANGKVTVDLTNAGKVQSDWDETNDAEPSFIRNKPNLSGFATKTELTEGLAGKQNTLTAGDNIVINGDTISATAEPQQQADWAQTDSSAVDYIKNKPNLATVATSGSYDDLSNKPTIPAAQVQSDWAQTNSSSVDFIKNKPTLATVATSGSYTDLSNKPSIPAAQVQSDWNQTDNTQVDYIKNKPAPMQTQPLVAGTNMEFVSSANSVTINTTATKVITLTSPYTTDVPLARMGIYNPGSSYGSVVKDGAGETIGFLAPKHYGQADEGKVLTIVSDNGYKMEWRPQVGSSSDLKVLTEIQQTVNSGTGAYQLTIVDGSCYVLTLAADREVQLATNSTDTLHTRISIRNYDENTCGGCTLTWRDEGLLQHSLYLMLYNQPYTVEYFFDVYIKKVVVNGTPYAIARVHDYPCAYRNGVENGYTTDNINFIGRDY